MQTTQTSPAPDGTMEDISSPAPSIANGTDPSSAVSVALQMERENMAKDLMLRRASMPGITTNFMGINNAASPGTGGLGLNAADGANSLEMALAMRRDQHNSTMEMHRQLMASNGGLAAVNGEAAAAVEMAVRRASLGFGGPVAPSPRPSLGLGMFPMSAPGPAGPMGVTGTDPTSATVAALSQARMASSAAAAAAAPSMSDQQTLLRLAQIRTARAEVQAAQARLAELETQTAFAASNAASNAASAAVAANLQAAAADANSTGGDNKKSSGEADPAAALLSLSGKQDEAAGGNGAPSGDANANAAAAAAAAAAAQGAMPRRVSMDLLSSARNPNLGQSATAHLAEALMAQRRLSDAASASAIEAAARQRRITLPVVSGYGMEQALTMSALGGRKRKAGVDLPAASSPYNMIHNSGEGSYLVHSGISVPTVSETSGAKNRARPADAPRRPLSAYNFFFIEERERILKAMKEKDTVAMDPEKKEDKDDEENGDGEDKPKETVDPLAGINLDDSEFVPLNYDELMTLRLNNKEKPRPHRKTHGRIGFQTLAKLIASRWKNLSDERRTHYKSHAAIDMEKYKERTAEYQKKKLARVEYDEQQRSAK